MTTRLSNTKADGMGGLSTPPSQFDNFSNKTYTNPYMAVDVMQANLFVEDMTRRAYGKVNSLQCDLDLMEPQSREGITRTLISLLARTLGLVVARCDGDTTVLFGRAFVVTVFYPRVQHGKNFKNIVLGVVAIRSYQEVEEFVEYLCKNGFTNATGVVKDALVPVDFALPTAQGVQIINKTFPKLPLMDIQCNYVPRVVDEVKRVLGQLETRSSGLLILNGLPGTGKTYLIKSILSEVAASRTAVVCVPAMQFLTQVGLLTSALAQEDKSILVLEDIGSLLEIDSPGTYSDQRSNLLNLSEGLLSLLSDTVIILSFNHTTDKKELDPALFRPGRCLAYVSVPPLPFAHAQSLVGFPIPTREYTLAEVYEMRRIGNPLDAERPKIGLQR